MTNSLSLKINNKIITKNGKKRKTKRKGTFEENNSHNKRVVRRKSTNISISTSTKNIRSKSNNNNKKEVIMN